MAERRASFSDRLPLFLLSLYAGCYYFAAILICHLGVAPETKQDYSIFISSWALIPALTLASVFTLRRLKESVFPGNPAYYPALLSLNTLVWTVLWAVMPAEITARYLGGILILVPLCSATAHGIAAVPRVSQWAAWPLLGRWAAMGTPLAVLIGLKHFDSGAFPPKSTWMAMLALAGLATWLAGLEGIRKDHAAGKWLGLGFLTLFIPLMISIKFPGINGMLIHHQNFYLGPVNDIVHGKTMLIDVNCQYGVGVIYFLAMIFKTRLLELCYPQFSYLIMLLWILQYLWLFWMLQKLLVSQWLVIVCMGAALLLERFGYYVNDNIGSPSVGPLRFGLPLLVLSAVYLRKTRESENFLRKNLDLIFIGIASLWSFETFVYSLAGYGAALFYAAWAEGPEGPGSLRRLGEGLARLALALLGFHALFALATLLRAGQLPDWNRYLDYIRLYGPGRFGHLNFEVFSPWIFLSGLSFITLMAACFGLFFRRGRTPEAMFAFALTVTGIAEFSYYVGRSESNNLSHACFATVVAAFYWLDKAWADQALARGFKRACMFSAMLILFSFAFAFSDNCQERFVNSLLYHAFRPASVPGLIVNDLRALRSIGHEEPPQMLQLAALMDKYLAPGARAGLFIHPVISTEALLYAKRSHLLPISEPIQDSLLPGNVQRAVAAVSSLKAGDILFVGDAERLWGQSLMGLNIGESVLMEIRKQFSMELLEHSPLEIRVFRLAQRRV